MFLVQEGKVVQGFLLTLHSEGVLRDELPA